MFWSGGETQETFWIHFYRTSLNGINLENDLVFTDKMFFKPSIAQPGVIRLDNAVILAHCGLKYIEPIV